MNFGNMSVDDDGDIEIFGKLHVSQNAGDDNVSQYFRITTKRSVTVTKILSYRWVEDIGFIESSPSGKEFTITGNMATFNTAVWLK
jgi:hypothetical protein